MTVTFENREADALIASVKRALAALTFLARRREARVVEVAEHLQVNKSSASRLLQTLANEGFVERVMPGGGYRLGLAAADIGLAFLQNFELRDAGRLALQQLFERTGETVLLVIPTSDGRAMCIDKLEPNHYLRTHARIGEHVPIHCGSAAKVLLAHMPRERIDELLSLRPLKRFTVNTITDPQRLKEELGKIREQGYSVSLSETTLGVAGVAAPIFDHTGQVVAALSVGGPDTRITPERIEDYAEYVVEAAQNASRTLGHARVTG